MSGFGHVEFEVSVNQPDEDISQGANTYICVCM